MGEHFNNFINHNRPNLVDYSLLQKINDSYKPAYSNFFTFIPPVNENKLLGGVVNNIPSTIPNMPNKMETNMPINMPINMPTMTMNVPVTNMPYLTNQHYNSLQETKPLTFLQYAGNVIYKSIKENLFISIIVVSLILFLAWCYVEKKRHDKIQEKMIRKEYMKSLLDEELFIKEPDELNINELFKDIQQDIQEPIQEQTKEQSINNKQQINNIQEVNVVDMKSSVQNKPNSPPMIYGPSNVDGSNKFMDISNFNNSSFMLL